jgi:CBS domain-containing protein
MALKPDCMSIFISSFSVLLPFLFEPKAMYFLLGAPVKSFRRVYPSGGIWMRFDLKIGECMTKSVITLESSKTVYDAAILLSKKKIGSIIITRNKAPAGIITERDIICKIVAKGKDAKTTLLKSAMSSPLKTILDSQTIQDAALEMRAHNIKRLAVFDKKENLAGIITESDLITVYPGIVDIMAESPHMSD